MSCTVHVPFLIYFLRNALIKEDFPVFGKPQINILYGLSGSCKLMMKKEIKQKKKQVPAAFRKKKRYIYIVL